MIVATFLIAILILGQACLFQFVFWPSVRKSVAVADATPHEQADSKYRDKMHDLLALVLFYIFCAALTLVWYFLIKEIVGVFESSPGDVIIALPPVWEIWKMVALGLAILGCCIPLDLIGRALLPKRYEQYLVASCRRHPGTYRGTSILWMNWGVSACLIALLALSLHSYTHFRSDSIAFSHFFSFAEVRHGYTDVVEIARVDRKRAPNRNLVDRPHIAVRFANGRVWTSIDGLRDSDSSRDERILQLLQEKTGLAPTDHDTFS